MLVLGNVDMARRPICDVGEGGLPVHARSDDVPVAGQPVTKVASQRIAGPGRTLAAIDRELELEASRRG
jgi:hypothetical protein